MRLIEWSNKSIGLFAYLCVHQTGLSPVGQKPTKEQLRQIREIAKKPIHYTEDCPESTPEALAEFAEMARTRRQRKVKPKVSLRVEPVVLEKYKSLGDGYTSIMADVLNYVANNPEILSMAFETTVSR
jgi:uncharacterized protein (DUF4415 family)